MGELELSITSLKSCPKCAHSIPMIFQDEKKGWEVVCSFHTCGYRTKQHTELLDACDEWGLKESE